MSLADTTIAHLETRITPWGFKPSHAARMLRRYYQDPAVPDWASLKLPVGLGERVASEVGLWHSELAARQVSDDGTAKVLLRLPDQRTVEAVMMPDFRGDRAAGCISSQVGCAMGCDFCATTKTGFERNLTAGEIVEQFLRLRIEAKTANRTLYTLVFMGMGEPMLNLDNVIEAIRRIGSNELGGFGWRGITVSTVGIIPGIERLAESGLGVALALSLHAPDDATREKLLPAGRRFAVADVLAAADRYQERVGRISTIQYCLLKGVNDSPEQAHLLADLVGQRRMHVNLLRYNPTGLSLRGLAYEASEPEVADRFLSVLMERKVVSHFRRPRGRDIDAACGQLRRRQAEAEQKPGEVAPLS